MAQWVPFLSPKQRVLILRYVTFAVHWPQPRDITLSLILSSSATIFLSERTLLTLHWLSDASTSADKNVNWLRFYVLLNTKYLVSETFPKPVSWLGMEKLNPMQQKHTFTNQKKCTTTQNKHKKLKSRFSRLLRHPAWKRRGPIPVVALH